jgi:hypothetical protein
MIYTLPKFQEVGFVFLRFSTQLNIKTWGVVPIKTLQNPTQTSTVQPKSSKNFFFLWVNLIGINKQAISGLSSDSARLDLNLHHMPCQDAIL